MNEEAERIYDEIKERARRHPLQFWGSVRCIYYPDSRRFNWSEKGSPRDITKSLTKRQVISLINIEIEHRAETGK